MSKHIVFTDKFGRKSNDAIFIPRLGITYEGINMINEFGGDFFQWLRGFYYVAKTGSVSLAASKMGRNQPAISHQIKCLENEFGVTLFNRSAGKMELTAEGKEIFDKSLSLFEIVKRMKAEINENKYKINGQISIATTHAVIFYYLAEYVVNFKKNYADVNFILTGGGFDFILDQVESSEVDFGIAYIKTVPDSNLFYKLFSSVPMLVTPKKGPFSINEKPKLEQLSELPFILFPNYSTLVQSIKELFIKNSLYIDIILELNNFDTIKKYVELGMGVSILEGFTITSDDHKRLNIYLLEDYFESRTYGIVIRKGKYLSPAVKAFLRKLNSQIQL